LRDCEANVAVLGRRANVNNFNVSAVAAQIGKFRC
jgi:hypothetical protein